jgi:flagellar hook-associated protein 3 FlgL
MRVTTSTIGAQVTTTLQNALSALVRRQSHISSGRRVDLPSDDPAAFAQTITLRSTQAAAEQYRRNLGLARGSLQNTEIILRTLLETTTQAKEAALLGATGSLDTAGRLDLATTVDALLEDLVSTANARDPSGQFVFGGQETTTAPYTATRDVNGTITAVTVNPRGIDGTNVAEVANGVTLATSVSGTVVFGATTDTTYAFDVLIRLRDALLVDAATGAAASLDELTIAIDRITSTTTEVGTRLGWISRLEERLDDESVADAASLSRVEDLDMVKAIQEFSQARTAFEGALSSSAQLLQLSLVYFLR